MTVESAIELEHLSAHLQNNHFWTASVENVGAYAVEASGVNCSLHFDPAFLHNSKDTASNWNPSHLSHAAQHAGFSLTAALLAPLKRSKKTRNCCLFKDCIVLTPHHQSCFVALKSKQTVTFVYHCPSIEVHFFPALLFRMFVVKNLLSNLSKLTDGYLRDSQALNS